SRALDCGTGDPRVRRPRRRSGAHHRTGRCGAAGRHTFGGGPADLSRARSSRRLPALGRSAGLRVSTSPMYASRLWLSFSLLALPIPAAAAAQATLSDAAARAKAAWSAHDALGLVGRSSTIILQIPGADPSSPLGRAQAIELLRQYFR